jgi:hypothetical protein
VRLAGVFNSEEDQFHEKENKPNGATGVSEGGCSGLTLKALAVYAFALAIC